MTRASLQHRVLDGDRVEVRLTDEFGRATVAVMAGAIMRAKAWGLLADLDPAGLMDAAIGQRLPFEPADEGAFSVSDKIVLALAHGPKSARGLRAGLKDRDHRAGDISTRCSQLAKRGLIERTDGTPGRGHRATWRLTESGASKARHLGGTTA